MKLKLYCHKKKIINLQNLEDKNVFFFKNHFNLDLCTLGLGYKQCFKWKNYVT